jgi:hypothetical protein
MGKAISLFSGYSQSENRTTNYCLLILKLLYEENPKLLGDFLNSLPNIDIGDTVGVQFEQQIQRTTSVPDGLILQQPLTIYIETKNFDWFYDSQLENHLDSLVKEQPGRKVLIALGSFEDAIGNQFEHIEKLCEQRSKVGGESISFSAVSFEEFISVLDDIQVPKTLADIRTEFRAYLDEMNLLPTWTEWLDVVSCGGLPDEVKDGNVYLCPAVGGAYSHSRCKYFGMYRNKTVESIAHIDAVVDLIDESTDELKWNNTDTLKGELIQRAREKLKKWRADTFPTRVFLLGPHYETRFHKESRGGVRGKRYFDIGSLNVKDAKELAEKLRGKPWTDLQ